MPYEKRVGERFAVGDMRVRWSPVRAPHMSAGRAAKRRGKHETDHMRAYMRSVSASGAGIVAPADDTIAPGSAVDVEIGPEATFQGRVRRIVATSDAGWWYYGVESSRESEGYREWINKLLDLRRSATITESHWRSSF